MMTTTRRFPVCCYCENRDFLIAKRTAFPGIRQLWCPVCGRTVRLVKWPAPKKKRRNPITFSFLIDIDA